MRQLTVDIILKLQNEVCNREQRKYLIINITWFKDINELIPYCR